MDNSPWLPPRHLKLVAALAAGTTLQQAGFECGLKESSVKFYMAQARRRTGSTTTAHLVAQYVTRALAPLIIISIQSRPAAEQYCERCASGAGEHAESCQVRAVIARRIPGI
jgi:DNA-binding CsgD family transcriptional regulator